MNAKDTHARSPDDPKDDAPAKRLKSASPTISPSVASTTDMGDSSPPQMETQDKVAAFPKEMPMANKFTNPTYFARDCFPTYYNAVMDLLATKKGVTVTGTPGIGTSVFMGYFFQCYSRDHSDATVVLASFNRESVLQQVATARGGKVIKVVRYQLRTVEETVYEPTLVTDEPLHKAAIWLLDGPPSSIPDDVHWVSFTSPLESWMQQLAANPDTCAKVYMPIWKRDELREAATKLGRTDLLAAISEGEAREISIDVEELDDESESRPAVVDARFDVFGGVARWCLATDRAALREAFRLFVVEANALTYDGMRAAYAAHVVPQDALRVLQYHPTRDIRDATLDASSAAFEKLLYKRDQAIASGRARASLFDLFPRGYGY